MRAFIYRYLWLMGGSGVGAVPVLAALSPARRRRGDRRWEMEEGPCAWHRHAGMGAGTAWASRAVGPARGSRMALPGGRKEVGRLSLLSWPDGRLPHVTPSDSAPCMPTATPATPWSSGCQEPAATHSQRPSHERAQQWATGQEQRLSPARRRRGDRSLPAESTAPSATQEPRGRSGRAA